MYYLITYGVNKHTSNKTRFMHKIVEDPLLEIMNMQQNNDGNYTLINALEIDEDRYITQSIETIKYNLEFK